MKAPILVSLGLALTAALTGGVSHVADAATSQSINTSGNVCNPFNASEALDIDYLLSGVRTIAAAPRPVICSLPRHPITGPAQSWFLDGSNVAGQTTTCTLASFSFFGTLTGSVTVTGGSPTYDILASLPAVGFFDYVSVLCTVPANAGGVFFGAQAIDN